MGAVNVPSKGKLLQQLELLTHEAQQKIRAFAEGRTDHIGYIRDFRNRVQHCLIDIGETAKDELLKIAAVDLTISEGLQRYYDKNVFNEFDLQGGDPSEFLRFQKEYDEAMPAKLESILKLLNQVRDKMLGQPIPHHAAEETLKRRYGPKPAMERHHRIADVVTRHGNEWTRADNLERVAAALDKEKITVSQAWATWNPAARSWRRALQSKPENVVKAIKYSLKMATK